MRACAEGEIAPAEFQAVLRLAGQVWGSNIVRVAVRGCPRLDGPSSGLWLEPDAGSNRVRARIALVNEGDAPARNVCVVIPPPPGFLSDDPGAELAFGDLAPGESAEGSGIFRAAAPAVAEVRIEDAQVRYAGGSARLRTRQGRYRPRPAHRCSRRARRRAPTVRFEGQHRLIPAYAVRCAYACPAGGWFGAALRSRVHRSRAGRGNALAGTPVVPPRGDRVALERRRDAGAAAARKVRFAGGRRCAAIRRRTPPLPHRPRRVRPWRYRAPVASKRTERR